MSETAPIGIKPAPADPRDPRAAIARAASATGLDFNYLLAQAKLESGLDPAAKARTSSAAGLYQFTSGTWLKTLGDHGADHGLDWASAAINGGGLKDPATRAQVMALRYDPDASALMAAELADDNRADLTARLGREPDCAELYLAHFLGSGGAGRFLDALQSNPQGSAASLLPQAASANRAIFYDSGAPRSVAGVMDLIRTKVSGAMESGVPDWSPSSLSGLVSAPPAAAASGPIARQFHAVAAQMPEAARSSMADILRDAFGLSGGSGHAAPTFVRQAYDRMRSLDL